MEFTLNGEFRSFFISLQKLIRHKNVKQKKIENVNLECASHYRVCGLKGVFGRERYQGGHLNVVFWGRSHVSD